MRFMYVQIEMLDKAIQVSKMTVVEMMKGWFVTMRMRKRVKGNRSKNIVPSRCSICVYVLCKKAALSLQKVMMMNQESRHRETCGGLKQSTKKVVNLTQYTIYLLDSVHINV